MVIQEALDQLLSEGRRTTIVIAHRLTTIRKADKIAYVAGGRVLEEGTHDELMNSESGYYRALVDKQYGSKPPVPAILSIAEISGRSEAQDIAIDSNNPTSNEDSVVRFNNVTFAYPARPSKLILDKFSLTINREETVALVGEFFGSFYNFVND